MGLFGGTKKITSDTTPIVPDWLQDPIQGATETVAGLAGTNPSTLVAGVHPLLSAASLNAGALDSNPGLWDSAAHLTSQGAAGGANTYAPSTYGGTSLADAKGVTAQSLLTDINKYMSPYTKDVVDTSLADYDFGAGQTRAQQNLDLAGSGAFGGSGSALTRSLTEDALTRGRGSLSAGLRDQAFNTGANYSNLDAQRRQDAEAFTAGAENSRNLQQGAFDQQTGLFNSGELNAAGRFNSGQEDSRLARLLQAGGLMGNLATSRGADQRATVGTQADVGTLMRGIDQQVLDSPFNLASWANQQYGNLPLSLFTGEHKEGTEKGGGGGLLGKIGKIVDFNIKTGKAVLGG